MSWSVIPTRSQRAQGTTPLHKSELVPLLATRALTKPYIVDSVRRNCVTFQPTAHDRAELRAAGADDAVLAALDECLRARLARAAPRSPPPAPSARPRAPAPARPSAPPPAPLPVVVSPPATPIDP